MMFEHRTIAELAAWLEPQVPAGAVAAAQTVAPAPVAQAVPDSLAAVRATLHRRGGDASRGPPRRCAPRRRARRVRAGPGWARAARRAGDRVVRAGRASGRLRRAPHVAGDGIPSRRRSRCPRRPERARRAGRLAEHPSAADPSAAPADRARRPSGRG
ncbi:hypothetical protein LV779_14940 [Streptomyces thinghirensis]|nr:hypothetical protein [Streptomyces thinghirensis]